MARAAGYPITLDPFLARPFFVHDYEDEVASLLFEVRGRGTALLYRRRRRPDGQRASGARVRPSRRRAGRRCVGGGIGVSPLKLLGQAPRPLRRCRTTSSWASVDAPEAYAAVDRRKLPGRHPWCAPMDGSAGTAALYSTQSATSPVTPAVYACGPNSDAGRGKAAVGRGHCRQLSRGGADGLRQRLLQRLRGPVCRDGGGTSASCVEGPDLPGGGPGVVVRRAMSAGKDRRGPRGRALRHPAERRRLSRPPARSRRRRSGR